MDLQIIAHLIQLYYVHHHPLLAHSHPILQPPNVIQLIQLRTQPQMVQLKKSINPEIGSY